MTLAPAVARSPRFFLRGFARFGLLAAVFGPVLLGCSRSRPVLPEPGSYDLNGQLEIHLFAAEPDVVDPVALTFDAAERMYVVEMRDYPEGLPPDGRPGGAIRLLEDTDRDGRADSSTVFAEGLSFPTSIAPWQGGVFVTAPPQILYLEDLDGDRRADRREVVYDGFTLGVTDSNVNGLRWGIDNRIHGVNGGNGGHVRAGPESRWTALRGLDFRFDPRTRAIETTYHTAGGFGLVFDPWGRSFSPYNIDHLQQRIVPARYLARSPALPPLRATGNISVHGAMARIFPISVPATRPNHPEQAGHYSAAGGIGWLDFAGEGLPRGILVCDVVGNLVSREVPRMEGGPVYVAERAPEEREREFFASRDAAFRPIGVEMGPDGALYLIDLQRDTIEHPDYIPEVLRRTLDLRAGSDRGRIYRIVPRGGLPEAQSTLAEAPLERLVAELGSASRWRRDTAQRLLIERAAAPSSAATSTEPPSSPLASLRAMVIARTPSGGTPDQPTREERRRLAGTDGVSRQAFGRLHALWTLEGLGGATEEVVLAALEDPEPGVRENALRVAETLLPGTAALRVRMVAMADDPSPVVRFQAALTLGDVEHPGRAAALERMLRRDARHRWSRVAVSSALGDGAAAALTEILRRADAVDEVETVARELADLVGAGLDRDAGAELTAILRAAVGDPESRPAPAAGGAPPVPASSPALFGAVMAGLDSGIERAADPPAGTATMATLLDRAMASGAPSIVGPAWRVRRALGLADGTVQRRVLVEAVARASDRTVAIEERAAAADLLALGARDGVTAPLLALVAPNQPSQLQARAVAALAELEDPALGGLLVERFRGLGPGARDAALAILLRRPALHTDLVAALEEGRLSAGELDLDLEQRRRLLRSEAPGVAERAAAVLDDDEYGNRAAVVETWLTRLPARGSVERGRAIFDRLCAQCHVAGGAGQAVGPDLASLAHRSAEDLVSNILDPDLAIHPGYVAFEVSLRSGDRVVGLIDAESSAAVTLLRAGGERRVIARAEIEAILSTRHSLMPAGLEQGLAPQDLRDLVELIQGGLVGTGSR